MYDYAAKLNEGLTYHEFLARHGTADQRLRWGKFFEAVQLTDAQHALLSGFQRTLRVACLAGAWCGDCVNQCPIFQRFAEVTPKLDVRYFDRDTHPDLTAELKICGGARVPVVVFLSEDAQPVGWYGDRTLSKYRQLAREQLGSACPTGIGPIDQSMLAAVTQEWLNEFERAHLLLRLSSRLRTLHGD
ncbi:MAG: thioredoxin family protein [Planctomycetota bacterium]|nr:thioredoxin family protein [Planctomycetota bacterium]